MPEETGDQATPSQKSLVNPGAFFRSLVPPLIVWGVLVVVVTLGGQPGVVCVTPMAWLLALWSGIQYVKITQGQGRSPLLGPALVGALLGVGEGIFFAVVASVDMPPSSPGDLAKTQTLVPIIFIASVVACTGLSAFNAWLGLRRMGRRPPGKPG